MDILGDVLRAIRLKGSVYFNACFGIPWGMALAPSNQASFHLVVRGDAWVALPDLNISLKMNAGDIVFFPKGAKHTISDAPDSHCLNGIEVVEAYQGGNELFSGNLASSNIVCGYVAFDRSISHPFIDNLPQFIHINTRMRTQFYWLDSVIEQIIIESREAKPGSGVLVDRFTEVLFIQIVRAYAQQSDSGMGYFSALMDKQLSQALDLIHNDPGKEWTVELLAKAIGMSRSAFYARFNQFISEPPMQYLYKWRMMKAKEKLENTKKPIITVAQEVGYCSNSAFQKAFKRFFNLTPASLRKKIQK